MGVRADRPNGYYESPRPDVAALVPAQARRILDVGCATGRLGASLKAGAGCDVYGVEVEAAVAEQARACLDGVVVGDIESLRLPFPERFFDCILYADVLEHLRDPLAVLRSHRAHLADGGSIVVSLPNVRFCGVLLPLLLQGQWRYERSGVLDEGHLRFFTRSSAQAMLVQAGYEVVRTACSIPRSRRYRVPNLLTAGLLCEFMAPQLLLLARKSGEGKADG
jgi:SAM-dependent methyltransferase